MSMPEPLYRTADNSALRIWRDVAKNNFLSEKHGRPIFDEVTYVEVITPGSNGATPVFEVKRVFAAEAKRSEPLFGSNYAKYEQYVVQFEKGEGEAGMSGTPLSEWPEISRSMAASLHAMNIFSVEALSAVPDALVTRIGPDGRSLREKAKTWLAASADSGLATALSAELERAKTDLAAKDAAIADLSARLEALEQAGASKATKAPVAPVDALDGLKALDAGAQQGLATPAASQPII